MSKTLRTLAADERGESGIEPDLIAAPSDRRTFVRAKTAITGRFFVPTEADEQACIVTDISLGGAFAECVNPSPAGTEIVLSAEGLDQVSGTVVRITRDGMAIRFDSPSDLAERMTEKLLSYLGRCRGSARRRRHERAQVPEVRQFTRPSGEIVHFEVVDLSLSGACLTTRIKPPVGELLVIGKSHGRVVRHLEYGIAIEFCHQLPQRRRLWSEIPSAA
jgi:hypothetical protein